jgi:hypothetical protein
MAEVRRLSLEEFLADERAPQVDIGARFNGGAFMCCHVQVFAETGIWIEDLVPAFQMLDAHLAVKNERVVKELSPSAA